MLKQLLARKLISEKEYTLVKQRLMKDYKVLSDAHRSDFLQLYLDIALGRI